ncbi:MAG: KTSC domain-containing protein [Alphaproteobacteria bacterium]|nr:KTSC domain-containing protein [Alphaproteobacteria bacterium]
MIECVNVSSSNIRQICFDNNSIIVYFHSGGVYKYINVSKSVFDQFINSISKGQFLDNVIKPNYDFVKL